MAQAKRVSNVNKEYRGPKTPTLMAACALVMTCSSAWALRSSQVARSMADGSTKASTAEAHSSSLAARHRHTLAGTWRVRDSERGGGRGRRDERDRVQRMTTR